MKRSNTASLPKKQYKKSLNTEYRLLFEKNPLPMWVFDPESYKFLAVNDAAVKHYGYSRREFLAMKSFDIRMPEAVPKLQSVVHKFQQTLSPSELGNKGIWEHITKKGKHIYVEITWSQIQFEGHTALLVLAHDVTDRKISEEAVRALNRKISYILESITDIFFTCDTDWNFTYLNIHAEKLLNRRKTELMGKNIWKVMPHLKNTLLGKNLQQSLQEQLAMTFEYQGPRSHIWLRIHTYPSPEGLSVYASNITEQKEIELRKDEFISIATHELKTPVTSLQAYFQLLERASVAQATPQVKEYFARTKEQIATLVELLQNLLDVSSIQTGRLRLHKDVIDLQGLVKEVVGNMQQLTSIHTFVREGNLPHSVWGDKARIAEVLTNLCVNAIKYSPKGGKIKVMLRSENDMAFISVKDFGIGIPQEMKERIFKRFYRVKEGAKQKVPGLGLGLYISANIVKQHGGEITVESAVGKGSTFTFSLPLSQKN